MTTMWNIGSYGKLFGQDMKIPLLLVSCSALALGFPIGKPPWTSSVNILANREIQPQATTILPSIVYEPAVQSTQAPDLDKRAPFFGFKFRYYRVPVVKSGRPYRGYYRRRSEGSFRYTHNQQTAEQYVLSQTSDSTRLPKTTHAQVAAKTGDREYERMGQVIDRPSALTGRDLATTTTILIPTMPSPEAAVTPTPTECSDCWTPGAPRGRPFPYMHKRAVGDRWHTDTSTSSGNSRPTKDFFPMFASTVSLQPPPKYTIRPPATLVTATPARPTATAVVGRHLIIVTVTKIAGNPGIYHPPPTSTSKFTTTRKPAATPTRTPVAKSSQADLLTRPPLLRPPIIVVPIYSGPQSMVTAAPRKARPTAIIIKPTPTSVAPTPTDTPIDGTYVPPDPDQGGGDDGNRSPARPYYVKRRASGNCDRYPSRA